MIGSFATGAAGDTYRKRARKVDFPEEAVEVRQRMAHGSVPGVSELRWVCGILLQFLFTNYWSAQERHIQQMEASAAAASSEDEAEEEPRAPASVEDMRALLDMLSASSDEDADVDVPRQPTAVCTTPTPSKLQGPRTDVEGFTKIGHWIIS
ncbi:unnamed protein product [Phytomonas sp. Hart1]|nr:unnamed protein product [Phytomonas sp. Hart1]|eukprot:CCW71726.1 unnamed protein product [Phytomonas sp. isolate Hart1]